MRQPKVDDQVCYWSEPRMKGGPPGGPFPARIVSVATGDIPIAELRVEVAAGTFKTKTGVLPSDKPEKYRWTWPAK
jgi:hypothetical protein